jgi:MYXO-CTERM domain-containing protein
MTYSIHLKPTRTGVIMINRKLAVLSSIALAAITTPLNADITGCYYESYQQSGLDFAGNLITCQIADLYLTTNDTRDLLLNVFNLNISNCLGTSDYYQSMTGNSWLPSFAEGLFDTEATRNLDSFITIGAQSSDLSMGYDENGRPTQPNANGTIVDPNFGGANTAAPAENAGWANGNPTNQIGHADFTCMLPGPLAEQPSIFIGRFAIETDVAFNISGTLGVCSYQGFGTAADCVDLNIVQAPAPGALALLGVAGLTSRSRRRKSE